MWASGSADEVRAVHARHFAGRETDILALWDSPRQRDAYTWFTTELANVRTAFRWAADHGDLDVAATIAIYAAFLGFWVENSEPTPWAEELIEAARAGDHPLLESLYVMASLCWMAGRIDDGVRYGDAAQTIHDTSRHAPPYGVAGGSEPHTWPSASPNGGPRRAVPSLHGHDSTSPSGLVWFTHSPSPVPMRRRWLPRTA